MAKKDEKPALITLEKYQLLSPRAQGYVVYMEAEHPGSELKDHQKNPYVEGSRAYDQWNEGQQIGVQDAQDGDD